MQVGRTFTGYEDQQDSRESSPGRERKRRSRSENEHLTASLFLTTESGRNSPSQYIREQPELKSSDFVAMELIWGSRSENDLCNSDGILEPAYLELGRCRSVRRMDHRRIIIFLSLVSGEV